MLIQWIIAIAFLAFGGLIIVTNTAIAVLRFTRGRKSSMILIVGGVAAAIGIYALPNSTMHRWFWVPLLVDIGCVPIVAALLAKTIFDKPRPH